MLKEEYMGLSRNIRPTYWIIFMALFVAIHIPAIQNGASHANKYILLSKSLLRGELSLSPKDMTYVEGTKDLDTGDLLLYQGKYFLPYPPAPAILLIPFVFLGGGSVNTVLVAVLLSCLNLFLIYSILKKVEIGDKYVPWLICGFIFGTSYWYVLLSSHQVYGFAQVVAVTSLFLLLNELFGKSRALLLGLFLGVAFLSRQLTIVFVLFVIGYFVHKYILTGEHNLRQFWKKTLLFSFPIGIALLFYLIYNFMRFGNPLDSGYEYLIALGVFKERINEFGVFSLHYVPINLYNYLLRGFDIEFTGKQLMHIKDMNIFGTSLLAASPFFVAAFKSGWDKFLLRIAWVTIIIIFGALLLYHSNGKDQVNASRYTLDFLPLLLIIAGRGIKNIPGWLFKGMICYAVILNIIGFTIHLIFHTMK